MPGNYVLTLNEIDSDHSSRVGVLGEKLGQLTNHGIPVPPGFVINSNAFEKFKEENNLDTKTKHLINTINFSDPHSVGQVSGIIKKHFLDSHFPKDIANEIYLQYKKLGSVLKDSETIIRLSPASHHSRRTNFFKNVKGETNLMEKIKECWATNFDEDRLLIGFTNSSNHSSAILVHKLINPESSGKIYTSNPFENVKNQIVVTAMYGHHESRTNFVSMPDVYIVSKKSNEIETKEISNQLKKTIEKNNLRKLTEVPSGLRKKQKISDKQIQDMADLGKKVENIYFFPQEIDWSIQDNQIYLTHIKPITHTHKSTVA